MPRRPASGFPDDRGYPVVGGNTADPTRSGGNHDELTRYDRPTGYEAPAGYPAPTRYPVRSGYETPAGHPARGAYPAPAAPVAAPGDGDTQHIQRPSARPGPAARDTYPAAPSYLNGSSPATSSYPARDGSVSGATRYGSAVYARPGPATPAMDPRARPDRPARPQPSHEYPSHEHPSHERPAHDHRRGNAAGRARPVGGSATGPLDAPGHDELPAEPPATGAHRRSRDGLKASRDSLKGLVSRGGGEPGRRATRRLSTPSRRTMTIAAVTTGTIAASTAAFAGVTPGGGADGGSEASLIGNSSSSSGAPLLLNIAQSVADTEAVATAVSITPDHASVAPNAPVMLSVRAVQSGGAPLADQPVRVVVAIGTTWRTTAVLRTDASGRASIPAHLLTTTKVSVIFDGTGALRPALASATTVNVVVPQQPTTGGGGGGGINPADVGLTNAPGSTIGSKAVYLASLQRGKPYVWGATGPYSFDCSGLVQYVYKQLGRYLPRTAESQYESTTRIAQSAKQPGDLIFFGSPGDIYHVAIYAGNGYIWQAPQTGETVQLVPIWSSSYYVGRVL